MLKCLLQHHQVTSPPFSLSLTVSVSLWLSLSSLSGYRVDWYNVIVIGWNMQGVLSPWGFQQDFISPFFLTLLHSSALSVHLRCPFLHASVPPFSKTLTLPFLCCLISTRWLYPCLLCLLIRYKAAVSYTFYVHGCITAPVFMSVPVSDPACLYRNYMCMGAHIHVHVYICMSICVAVSPCLLYSCLSIKGWWHEWHWVIFYWPE